MGVEALGDDEERVKGVRRGPRTEPLRRKNRSLRRTQRRKGQRWGRKPGGIYRNPVEGGNCKERVINSVNRGPEK